MMILLNTIVIKYMPKFRIKIDVEYIVDAFDEKHAEELFFDKNISEFINDNLLIEEAPLCESKGCKEINHRGSAWCLKHLNERRRQEELN